MIHLNIGKTQNAFKCYLGNQNENLDELLCFSFDEFFKEKYKYIIFHKDDISLIYPIENNQLIITDTITMNHGIWEFQIMCRDNELDLLQEVIDLKAKDDEYVFVSDVSKAIVNESVFSKGNTKVDEMDLINHSNYINALKTHEAVLCDIDQNIIVWRKDDENGIKKIK